MKYNFGSIVIVNGEYIGVVVKCWENFKSNRWNYNYDVYVRSWNLIENYKEEDLEPYIYDNQISDRENEETT